ncbi:TetR/AcrR family transcriptional regulator [Cochlodiniinecator piscidefendens]|uniref:TetR/AcrR family transcriptional regulator n=1 Tax=Cochlodiniinecator piscidefendens TaxID=2715756 RepID=UPI00140D3A00|nr:TetR/AcrR family transcriptional regulator [Cochlodiniinecator piscidefendens]
MNTTTSTPRRQARSVARETSILEASRRILIRDGFEKFSTNHVATEAGCNIGTVYKYFKDKSDIITRLYEEYLKEATAYVERVFSVIPDDISVEDYFVQVFAEGLAECTEEDHILTSELTKAFVLNREIQRIDKAHDDTTINLIARAINADRSNAPIRKEQIAYWFDLANTLLQLVCEAGAKNRAFYEEQAVRTMRATVLNSV